MRTKLHPTLAAVSLASVVGLGSSAYAQEFQAAAAASRPAPVFAGSTPTVRANSLAQEFHAAAAASRPAPATFGSSHAPNSSYAEISAFPYSTAPGGSPLFGSDRVLDARLMPGALPQRTLQAARLESGRDG